MNSGPAEFALGRHSRRASASRVDNAEAPAPPPVSFLFGLGLFGIVLLAAALAPWIAPVDPTKLAMRFKFRPPGTEFAFGTDNFGRSLWSRVIWGAQLSVIIGFSVVVLNAIFGTLIGALAGYFRVLDNGLMRVNDAMMAFPAILLAIGITAVLGRPRSMPFSLAIVYIPRTARIVRSSVIVLREMEYVQAASRPARGTGASCAATSCPTRWRR
jgi:peptide/nickel transport system permease protein